MLEGKGLEVIDLGTDVAPETFVQTARDQGCQIICCSALLTTTMGVMADVVKAVEEAGIRGQVKIMVGGAPCNRGVLQANRRGRLYARRRQRRGRGGQVLRRVSGSGARRTNQRTSAPERA